MGLADLAVSVVHPLLKVRLFSWDPLKVFLFIIGKILFLCYYIKARGLSDHFRTVLTVWKILVCGEPSLNPETSTPVVHIQTWILTTGHFKCLLYFCI